ncbi:putative Zinc finger, RING/FYVE/PHD-type [Helianthus anomalus]
MIQCYEDMLFDDGGPAYTTHLMKLEMNKGLVTSLISLDGSEVVDHETYVMITSNIMKYHESLHADDLSEETTDQEHPVKISGNSDDEKEEEDVCAICRQEFETGETNVALECDHGY